jgi:hypothetical protein
MAAKRWQDWGNAILGLWMAVSPWVLAFSTSTGGAARAAWILGAAIVVLAGVALYIPSIWEEGMNLPLGVCLAVSAFVLGYSEQPEPTANAVGVGVLVTLLALWALLHNTQVLKGWHAPCSQPQKM